MKKLLVKTSFFVLTFMILYGITYQYYKLNQGDLQRVGYIYAKDFNHKNGFENDFKQPRLFNNLSELSLNRTKKIDVLIVGDSFSAQNQVGYQNQFAKQTNLTVVNLDNFFYDSPLQELSDIANGTILDEIKVKYIVLQSVERMLFSRSTSFVDSSSISTDSLNIIKKIHFAKSKNFVTLDEHSDFFSRTTIRYPLYNIYYNLDQKAFYSEVYLVKTKQKLFKNYNGLAFLEEDVLAAKNLNAKEQVQTLNLQLNKIAQKLNQRGIKLLVLIAPDKYDVFYDEIVDKNILVKPLFFNHFKDLKKDYVFIDSKKVLIDLSKNNKDVYYYADTHWTPKAAKTIGIKIANEINTLETQTKNNLLNKP